jgi:hypothetical protein
MIFLASHTNLHVLHHMRFGGVKQLRTQVHANQASQNFAVSRSQLQEMGM